MFKMNKLTVCGMAAALSCGVAMTAMAGELIVKDSVYKQGVVNVTTPTFYGAAGGAKVDEAINLDANKQTMKNLYVLLPDAKEDDMEEAFGPLLAEDEDKVGKSLELIDGWAVAVNGSMEKQAMDLGTTIAKAGYYATLTYELGTATDELLSYSQTTVSYLGGAHENIDVDTKTINLNNGKELELKDLFKNGSYKKRLEWIIDKQQRSANALKKTMGKPEVKYFKQEIDGDEDFIYQTRDLSKLGLTLIYEPGEIAPMSEGVVTYDIPLDDIFDLMSDKKLK